MRRLLAIVALFAAFLAPLAAAAQTSDADRTAIQAVIGGQIDAFRRDDANAAWAAASPGIQGKFQKPDFFMAMVAGGYEPLYRPKSFTFGPLARTDGGPMQSVFVIGPDGAAYVAMYLMARQADGTWKVDGVSLDRDNQPSI